MPTCPVCGHETKRSDVANILLSRGAACRSCASGLGIDHGKSWGPLILMYLLSMATTLPLVMLPVLSDNRLLRQVVVQAATILVLPLWFRVFWRHVSLKHDPLWTAKTPFYETVGENRRQ